MNTLLDTVTCWYVELPDPWRLAITAIATATLFSLFLWLSLLVIQSFGLLYLVFGVAQ